MNILIIEDYPAIARSIERQLRSILAERIDSIAVASDLRSARARLDAGSYDLLLLDLTLGAEDGFDVLAWATCADAHAVVVSAHTDRAIEAFEHGVLDFVPKPVTEDRLRRALGRLDGPSPGGGRLRRLSVRGRSGYESIPLESIRRIQATGKYSTLHLLDGSERIHDKTLERLDALLPAAFIRVHRSHIVRLDLVQRLHVHGGGSYRLELSEGETVPVGRTFYAGVRRRLGHDS